MDNVLRQQAGSGQRSRLRPYDAHFPILRWMAEADWMSQLECPTLVVGAENDLFFDQDMLEATPSRIKHGTFTVVTQGGDLSTFEQPSQWAEAILAFGGGPRSSGDSRASEASSLKS